MSRKDHGSDPHERGDRAAARVAAGQHGAISYEQGLTCGLSDDAIHNRARSGRWQALIPRVYRIGGAPTTGHQACMAAALWGGEQALVSHRAAGVLWELDGVAGRRVEITVPRSFDRRSPMVVVHRTTRRRDTDLAVVAGIPITSPARTLIDLAGVLTPRQLELAVEDAFRRRLTNPDDLDHELWWLEGRGRSGCADLRDLLENRGATTDSAWETRLRRLLVDHGLPAPAVQHPVAVAGRAFRLDLAYPGRRVDIEFESLRWHTGRDRLEQDSYRRNLLRAAGWHIIHVTASMLRDQPEHVVAVVREALRVDVSREMYG